MNNDLQTDEKSAEEMSERIANLSPAKRKLLELKLKKSMDERFANESIPVRKKKGATPLSFAQQRLWFLNQLDPESPHYNIHAAWRLKGVLNIGAFHKALNDIVVRHETLRTTFPLSNGEPVQAINRSLILDLPITDLRDHPADQLETEIHRIAEEEVRHPFDLGNGPLLRCALIRLDAEDHVLLLTMHHIISDGWSMGLFFRELGLLYENHAMGKSSSLPAIPVQYADYSEWQRRWLRGDVLEKQLQYWKKQLDGVPPLLELPTDRPRPAVQRFVGASHTVILPKQLLESLNSLSRAEGTTLFMTLLAAFQLLLYRYSGQQDISIGFPIAGRNRLEVENLIGFFVNTLVFRADFSGNPTFREFLRCVRAVTLGGYEHQDLPFEKLVEELHPQRNLSYNPLFQVTFAMQNMPEAFVHLAELTAFPIEVDRGLAQFDLSLFANETDQEFSLRWVYSTDLFDAGTIIRMANNFQVLLEGIVFQPDQRVGILPILTWEERQKVIMRWNETRRDYPRNKRIYQLFENQVSKTPDNVAVVFEGHVLRYKELNEKANQLAHYLMKHGVGPDVLVGIFMERSLEMVIGILGILKAGGAYVPLDPSYPADRLAFVLQDAQAKVLLMQQGLNGKLPYFNGHILCLDSEWETVAREAVENPGNAPEENHLAYVIYTSGSTGKPKGVMIPHRAICNHMLWMMETFSLTEQDRVLQKTPFSFDASIWEFYAPLLVGGRLVMAMPGGHQDGEYLIETIAALQITTLQLVPSMLRMLLELGGLEKCTSLRRVFCGGEILTIDLQEEFFNYSSAELYNLYGPTEAAIDATWWACRREDERQTVPIGHPIANVQTYVLDSGLQPVPIGASGELHIGGEGLARGYLKLPELTGQKFIPDPFNTEPHARLYKTGDLVRYLPDGALEFLGRIDHQVKIRGYRIELGEIETLLQRHPAIQSVVVIVLEDMPGEERIAAYVTGKEGKKPEIQVLRRYLAQKLPEYMIPVVFIHLDAMPLLPNGKVNRKALPTPDADSMKSHVAFSPAQTPIERAISDIWCDVLGLDRVGVHNNFFEVGGHSLLAIRIVSRINAAFQMKLSVRSIFEAPTIAELAEKIQPVRAADEAAAENLFHGADASARHLSAIRIPPLQNRSGRYPLSYDQQRLWFLNQLEPGNPFYNIPIARRFKGVLHVDAMRDAINGIVARHEILRTTFCMVEGEPMQVIAPNLSIDLPLTDLSTYEPEVREEALKRLCTEDARRVFDLEQGPLLRCFLYRLGEAEHVMLFSMHHIISDEWSMEVFDRELWALYEAFYRGEPSPLAALPIQYADYAVWQRKWLEEEVLENQLNYWKQRLDGVPPILELPTDYRRPNVQRFQGAHYSAVLPAGVLDDLKTLSREAEATLFMTLLSVFQLMLHRYTGQDDIVVGSPIAGRMHAELENLIGFFVNTLVLRTNFGGNPTFRELLAQVREVTLAAYEHQDLPFEKLVEKLKPERSLSHNPFIQVMFSLQTRHEEFSRTLQLTVLPETVDNKSAKFDITLSVEETPGGLGIAMGYNTDLFNRQSIERMVGHFQILLKEIALNPERRLSDIPWLSESEYYQIMSEWNRTRSEYPKDLCVHRIFEEQAARIPDSVAVVFGNDRLTYAQLNTKADQVAHYLRLHGVGPEKRVGICVERSVEMVVGLLGILKAGGAYVPLDPAYPLERLSFMMEDAQIEMLLTQKKLIHRLPEFTGPVVSLDSPRELDIKGLTDNLRHADSADQLAYVMYTSGSTGKPKGVAVVHRGIVRLVKETNYVNLTSDEVILQFAPLSFDASTFEIWGGLLNGARLVIFPDHLPSLKELGDVLKQYQITTLWLTAGLFHQMVSNHLEGLKPVRQLLAGGDVLSPNLVKKALGTLDRCRLINGYGPTENTTFTCCHVMMDSRQVGNTVPIGRPISNTQVYILDKHLKPVPVGVKGELFIGGDGLARGYLNQSELTQEKFISNPFSEDPESRLYRSGDLVRYRPDGLIEFLGRKDTQVKIRGFRIELGEIESVLMIHSSVREVAVAVREDMHGDKRIAAYVVLKSGKSLNTEALRAFVMEKLPEYMVPSAFVLLDALPLTSNGKVDRKALPALSDDQERSRCTYQAPRDSLEIQLVKIWEKTLSRGNIGITDNFFDLGGHSLLAIQVISQIKKYLGKEIAVADLFKHPDIEHLAAVMRSEGWTSRFSLLIPFQPFGSKPPFFSLHAPVAEASKLIGPEQPFFSGIPHGFFGGRIPASVEEMAAEYLREIRTAQPEGPYYVGGYSFGGMVAFEVAQQLKRQGQEVALLVLIDATESTDSDKSLKNITNITDGQLWLPRIRRKLNWVGKRFMELNFAEKIAYVLKGVWSRFFVKTGIERKMKEYICRGCVSVGIPLSDSLKEFYRLYVFRRGALNYTPRKYVGHAVLFRAIKGKGNLYSFWARHIEKGLEIHELPGGHFDIFKYPQVAMFSEKLKMCLEKAQNQAQE